MIENEHLLEYLHLMDTSIDFDSQSANKMCDRARELIMECFLHFQSLDMKLFSAYDWFTDIEKLTPIEQIFKTAYLLFNVMLRNNYYFIDCSNILKDNLQTIFIKRLEQQRVVEYKDRSYRADFVIDFSVKDNNDKYLYPLIKNLKYVIELDGYNSHSNKEQLNYDYERENNLKELGFNVVRFTGSQIFKTPYTCIHKLYNIIQKDIKNILYKEN